MILLDNEPLSVPKFITAQKLLEDKFILQFSNNDKNIKKPRTIELTIGDIACFVKPHSDFVCDTIGRGILPKRHKPYYAEPKKYRSMSDVLGEQETEGLNRIMSLPNYRIEIPGKNLIKSLELINNEKRGNLTKKRLMDLALGENLIQVGKNKKNKDTSAYMALDTHILGPLQKWNFVTIEKSGKRRIVSLSEDGENALKFLNS